MSTRPDVSSEEPILDLANQRIQRDGRQIQLTPKAFAVLARLNRSPGQLVPKDELLEAAWPNVYVGEAVVKVAVREIRQALADDARAPRYLETVHRRGYRLIAELATTEDRSRGSYPGIPAAAFDGKTGPRSTGMAGSLPSRPPGPSLAGRQEALEILDRALAVSMTGRRQLVLVTGEAGIGKTALVSHWLERAGGPLGTPGLLRARGVCVPHYGRVEPYLALLDALGRLSRQLQAPPLTPLLWRYAPGWLAQMPWLVADQDRGRLERELFGSTRERMLRELAELAEALTAEVPLILVLEDLQHSDPATLDFVGYFVHRAEPCRCCIISTFRPDEPIEDGHPLTSLRRELQSRDQCKTLSLGGLDATAFRQVLAWRLSDEESRLSDDLVSALRLYCGGNPLFLESAVEDLREDGGLVLDEGRWTLKATLSLRGSGPPRRIRDVLDRRAERLSQDQRALLGAVSLVRGGIPVSALGAILDWDPIDTEDLCHGLSQPHGWLRRSRTGDVASDQDRYELAQGVYRHYWSEQVPSGRRRMLHLRLAHQLASIEADTNGHRASAAVAWHYGEGGDIDSALHHWQRAATVASARFAPREAAACLDRGLELLTRRNSMSSEQYFALLGRRNALLTAAGDLGRAICAYREHAALAKEVENLPELARAWLGLATTLFWVDREGCLGAASEALSAARSLSDSLLEAHVRGWKAHWESIIDGYSEERASAYELAVERARDARDPALECQHRALQSYARVCRSDYLGGCEAASIGLRLAEQTGDAQNYLACHFFKAWGHFYSGRWGEMRRTIEAGASLAAKNGHLPWKRHFDLQLAWLHIQAGDHVGARGLCEPVLDAAQKSGLRTSEWLLGLILLASESILRHDLGAAEGHLATIDGHLHAQPRAIDSVLKLPLLIVRIECLQGRHALGEARIYAGRLLDLAAVPPERTYCALAHTKLAEIALAEDDLSGAEGALQRAFDLAEAGATPVAAWRIHAVEAALRTKKGDDVSARRHGREGALVLARLARGLDPTDPLRGPLRARARELAVGTPPPPQLRHSSTRPSAARDPASG